MQINLYHVEMSMYLFVLFITGMDGGLLYGLLGFAGFSLFLASLAGLLGLLLFVYRRANRPNQPYAYAWQKVRRSL
jgi:hypothetical protein